MSCARMKTTIEIPDPLLRKAKAAAAQRGVSLKTLLNEALREKRMPPRGRASQNPTWMAGFGDLRRFHRETLRIQMVIDQTFGVLEAEDRM